MNQTKDQYTLPLHRRIVFWFVLPVVVVGITISGLLIFFLSPPINSFLNEHFEANLHLASRLGVRICETHFNQLLDMRLEDNEEMNTAFKIEALEQIKAIENQMPDIHMLVLEDGKYIKTISIEFPSNLWQLPENASTNEKIFDVMLGDQMVKAHTRYFPFWDWHITSFVKQKDFLTPISMAHRIIYFSTMGVLLSVFVTLLLVFYLAIEKPLHQLISATEDISEGRLIPIKPVKKNEIGQLTVFFNNMVESIKRKSDDIGDLVEQLKESEEQLQAIFEANPDPLVVYNTEGYPQYINPAFEKVFGWSLDELRGKRIPFVPTSEKAKTGKKIEEIFRFGKPVHFQTRRLTKRGDMIDVVVSAATIKRSGDEPTGMVVNLTDISDQRKLEAQFRHAQKMESVGRLAGGVAHDFNNMLGVILGHTEMAGERLESHHPVHDDLKEIKSAALRSADLTKQLLAFARKQAIAPKVLDLNATIEGMLKMLGRLIGEDIDIVWKPNHDLWLVKIDPSQIDQVLANLCVNARDAITGVGKIIIETNNASFDEGYHSGREGFAPGDYVMVAVSDNGSGMKPMDLENLFEPFFTTKGVGEGTGLGLATVYGIVRQNQGFINVYSELNKGSTFKIYFPRQVEKDARPQKPKPEVTPQQGSETILLVEDETAILKMTTMMLKRLGYTLISASSPGEAMRLCKSFYGEIDMLMTDVVMPEMSGRDLADKLLRQYSNLKCLFMSGYTADVIANHGVLDEGIHFINKPFSRQDLARKIREVFESSTDSKQAEDANPTFSTGGSPLANVKLMNEP